MPAKKQLNLPNSPGINYEQINKIMKILLQQVYKQFRHQLETNFDEKP